MTNVTLSVPLHVHRVMKRRKDIRWTEIARQALVKKAEDVEREDDALRNYSERRLAKEGEDAEEFFDL